MPLAVAAAMAATVAVTVAATVAIIDLYRVPRSLPGHLTLKMTYLCSEDDSCRQSASIK